MSLFEAEDKSLNEKRTKAAWERYRAGVAMTAGEFVCLLWGDQNYGYALGRFLSFLAEKQYMSYMGFFGSLAEEVDGEYLAIWEDRGVPNVLMVLPEGLEYFMREFREEGIAFNDPVLADNAPVAESETAEQTHDVLVQAARERDRVRLATARMNYRHNGSMTVGEFAALLWHDVPHSHALQRLRVALGEAGYLNPRCLRWEVQSKAAGLLELGRGVGEPLVLTVTPLGQVQFMHEFRGAGIEFNDPGDVAE